MLGFLVNSSSTSARILGIDGLDIVILYSLRMRAVISKSLFCCAAFCNQRQFIRRFVVNICRSVSYKAMLNLGYGYWR